MDRNKSLDLLKKGNSLSFEKEFWAIAVVNLVVESLLRLKNIAANFWFGKNQGKQNRDG